MAFAIEEVPDVAATWPELEPLVAGLIDYHRPWDLRILRPDWNERMRDWLVEMPERLTLLARDDTGCPIAFLDGQVTRDHGIFDEVFAFINNAFVVERERRSGVGSSMVQRFTDWAAGQGATDIRLSVRNGNELGEQFWRREGFQPESVTLHRSLERPG